MKLSLRFVLLIALLVVGVGASTIAGVRALNRLDLALNGVVSGDMERLLAITHTRRLFRSMVVLERDYMLSSSNDERRSMDQKLSNSARELAEQIDKYARLMPTEDLRDIQDIRAVRLRWLELDESVRKMARESSTEATKLAAGHAKDPVSWEAVIGKLVKANEARLAAQVRSTHASYETAKLTLILVSLGAVLLAAGLGSVIFLGIRRTLLEVVALNVNLETIVEVRTQALAAREQSLRLVLDSTGDGIIGVNPAGFLVGGASAAAVRWFGDPKPGLSAAEYLFPDDVRRQAAFSVAFGQLIDDILPWEVLVDQMPRRTECDFVILELEYKPVVGDPSGARILILARDISARVLSEQSEQSVREQQSLVAKLLSDKHGFSEFVMDMERLIQALDNERDMATLKHNLHTLKGNAAVYGLTSVAKLCHTLEDQIEETEQFPSSADVADLAALFRGKLQGIEDFLTSIDRKVFEVEATQHLALVDSLLERKDYQQILDMVETWTWARTSERLARLRGQIEYVSKRLNKPVRVEVEHHDLRLPAGYLEHFWPTLVHVARNAVDHGVEPAAERLSAGKAEIALIRLSTWQTDATFCICISDDGRGIDRAALLEAAKARGIPVNEGTSVADLVFADGLSSRSEVTEVSGRGVGLSATLEACHAAGGSVEIETRAGVGTSFVFRFRKPVVKAGSLAARVERRWTLMPFSENADQPSGTMLRSRSMRAS